MYNGHGDVTALLSEAGAIVGTYYYDVWGNILEKNESEQITNPYRYAGYQYDDDTGLYYLNARYYDAKIARFLTEDTVTGDRNDPLSLNRYAYCHNDPIRYTDPTGHREALDQYIEESDSEAARIARQKLEEANNNWAFYNAQLSSIPDKKSDWYKTVKSIRDYEHDKAEAARAEYAANSGDVQYVNLKYTNQKNQSTNNQQLPKNTNDPLSNITETRLTEARFLPIMGKDANGNDILFYGGDQSWYPRATQVDGGCGPTTAANILTYLASTVPGLERLYTGNLNELNKDEFAEFMEDVYEIVTPFEIPILSSKKDKDPKNYKSKITPTLGVKSIKDFIDGMESYAFLGKLLKIKAVEFNQKPTLENYVDYIRTGLSENKPVALLNLENSVNIGYFNPKTGGVSEQESNFHWVTITGMLENNQSGEVVLEVSTWGGKAILNFNDLFDQWQKFSMLDLITKPGMVYFEKK